MSWQYHSVYVVLRMFCCYHGRNQHLGEPGPSKFFKCCRDCKILSST